MIRVPAVALCPAGAAAGVAVLVVVGAAAAAEVPTAGVPPAAAVIGLLGGSLEASSMMDTIARGNMALNMTVWKAVSASTSSGTIPAMKSDSL